MRLGEIVKVVGVLRATEPLFTAPLSGATCLWYQAAAQVYRPYRYGPETIRDHRGQDCFIDDDSGSAFVRMPGPTAIRLEGMNGDWCYEPPLPGDERNLATTENVRRYVEAHGKRLHYHPTPFYWLRTLLSGSDYDSMFSTPELPRKRAARYREFVLRPGDRVAVVGQATERPDPSLPPAGRQPALRVVLGEGPDGVSVTNLPHVLY